METSADAAVDRPAEYEARRARFAAERRLADECSKRIAQLRVAAFLAGAGLLGWAVLGTPPARGLAAAAGTALLIGFAVLVARHARIERAVTWYGTLAELNDQAARRIRRDWKELWLPDSDSLGSGGLAEDLDLAGRGSLPQLLGPATAPGAERLAGWCVRPARVALARGRQKAVIELAGHLEFRQALAAHGRLAGVSSKRELERFLLWAESPPWLRARPWLLWTARATTVSTVGLIVLHAGGVTAEAWWVGPLALSLVLIALFQRRAHAALDRAAGAGQALASFSELFRAVAAMSFESPLLSDLQRRAGAGGRSAHEALARLDRIVSFGNLRLSAALLHFPIHAVTLWDFHVWDRQEGWQQETGARVRGWLDALGDLDALASLAGLRYDHPDWAMPELQDAAGAEPVLEATGIGHPLLAEAGRVPNDVTIGPPGTFLFITGSNMSGKSTLLRAIGVNVTLAQMGGPVCAARLRLPPLVLTTSMRVHDSVQEGVSYFMAGLRRLAEVVEAVRGAEDDPDRTALFLLDEILQGTNTAERQIATRAIVRFLLQHRAIGAITTHDLTLTDTPDLVAARRAVYFTEHVEDDGRAISFDYRLREGIATSRNALRLMRILGLPAS